MAYPLLYDWMAHMSNAPAGVGMENLNPHML